MKFQIADSFKTRLLGLMFEKKIDYGLLIHIKGKTRVSSSIHSCFMKIAIDVYFIDGSETIFEKTVLKPWSFHIPKKKADYVLETPVGFVELKEGEKINLDNLKPRKDLRQ